MRGKGGQGLRVRDGKRERHVESDREQVSEKTRDRKRERSREEETGDSVRGEVLTQPEDTTQSMRGPERGGGRAKGAVRENEGAGSKTQTLGDTGHGGDQPSGVGGGTSMVKAHLRAWGTAPSPPLPRGGAGGRWPRASHGPLEPLVSSPIDISAFSPRGHVWPVSSTEPVPMQPWEPSLTASWGAGTTGSRALSSEHVRSHEDQTPGGLSAAMQGSWPTRGASAQALAGRSEDQVPGDQTHHLPTCFLGNAIPWPWPRFLPLPSGPRRWDDPSSSESRSSIFCFCFHF